MYCRPIELKMATVMLHFSHYFGCLADLINAGSLINAGGSDLLYDVYSGIYGNCYRSHLVFSLLLRHDISQGSVSIHLRCLNHD